MKGQSLKLRSKANERPQCKGNGTILGHYVGSQCKASVWVTVWGQCVGSQCVEWQGEVSEYDHTVRSVNGVTVWNQCMEWPCKVNEWGHSVVGVWGHSVWSVCGVTVWGQCVGSQYEVSVWVTVCGVTVWGPCEGHSVRSVNRVTLWGQCEGHSEVSVWSDHVRSMNGVTVCQCGHNVGLQFEIKVKRCCLTSQYKVRDV